jgi:hypothetical protein
MREILEHPLSVSLIVQSVAWLVLAVAMLARALALLFKHARRQTRLDRPELGQVDSSSSRDRTA